MKLANRTALTALALLAAAATVQSQTQPQKPKAYMVADAHLDTQWNWDIQATIRDHVKSTLDKNLKLLEKYPDYVFNFEGGVKYSWMKEYYPREYEMMKKHIASGRWHISGASWDATDAIVPSVESALRNVLLGQEFYRSEFGVESTDIFLPDCFGFGWTLPTVASHCGLIGFSSQKLGWRQNPFHGDMKYPFNVGLWRGVDGSEIMMAHGYNYSLKLKDHDLTDSDMLHKALAENDLGVVYHYYGTGDIGGSPTILSVDVVDRAVKADGPIEVISAQSDRMFRDYQPYSDHPDLPRYDGELLMDVHGTGCYTSQAAMKLYNRQNELLGDAAERASVAAEVLGVATYPGDALTQSWRRFIFHQFHDDLTGTSIPRAYEFSWNDELLSLKQFADITTHSSSRVADLLDTRVKGTPAVLFNALGHEATDIVEMEIPATKAPAAVRAFGPDGKEARAQLLGYADGKARILVEATVPANGYAVYDIRLSGSRKTAATAPADAIENSVYSLKLNNDGNITSIVDKRSGRELVKEGKAVRLAIFTENESFAWPAWEVLKKTVDGTPASIVGDVKMTLVEQGPLRSTLCIEKSHGDSRFRQYVRLYEGALADRIDFYNEVDWATTNALVKAEFPLSVANPKACYDLGLGTIERGNNIPTAYEVYSQRWADLTDRSGDYGVTVMNDCKYGWDKPDDNTLRLTLLHTPKTNRGYAYQDHQDFGRHTFTYSLIGHQGLLDKAAASRKADGLNQHIKAFAATRHGGRLGRSFSLASIDNSDLAIKALKKAESGDEYVVRVYETAGKPGSGAITFAREIASAVKADGTEKTIGEASFSGNRLNVDLGANGLATFKVRLKPNGADRTPAYAMLPLAYDRKCFSWNDFAADGDFHQGYSYAAELIPDTLVASGVPFRLENKKLLNGKTCNGDTIAIPAGRYNRLYLLAAAATDVSRAEGSVKIGKSVKAISVPSYTGFIGQWGHTNHTRGYLEDDEVAFTGTHRHSAAGDHPYEFTYMFKYGIDIPAGAREIILPDNPDLVIFGATLASDESETARPLAPLFRTSIADACGRGRTQAASRGEGLLKPEHLTAWSGHVNEREHPKFLLDGDPKTKWCDTSGIPSFVEYDLGESRRISEWAMTNAGSENQSYVTVSCLLQTRNVKSEDWKTVDAMVGNRHNIVSKKLSAPVDARYVRLTVVQPQQSATGTATRIYEFNVY